MAMSDPPRPEPRRADEQGESATADEEQEKETSWLLAAALIETRLQGDGRSWHEVMGLLAEMTAERGAGTVTRAALGLADIAATLLEVCADSLKEEPQSVLGDVLAILHDDR
jgi:hypothetical protein